MRECFEDSSATPAGGGRPVRVLMVALEGRHISSCRLPAAFAAAGAEVGALADADSLMFRSRHVTARFPLAQTPSARHLLADLERACAAFAPDLLVPCDERTLWFLDHCRAQGGRLGLAAFSPGLRACLTRSLGLLDTLPARTLKPLTQRRAREIGVRAPQDILTATPDAARAAARRIGFPVMVKRPRSCGGGGVRICRTPVELEAACALWLRPRSLWRRLKARLRGRDWMEPPPQLSVQPYIEGRLAVTCAAAIEGRTLGVLSAVAERRARDILPADVLAYIARPDLVAASAALVAAFGASGFVSFDFLIDGNDEAWLLECNARPTPILPFGARAGLDLVGVFLKALAEAPGGEGAGPALTVREETRVALFPQALIPGPADAALRGVWHGVPWDEPELLRALLVELRTARRSGARLTPPGSPAPEPPAPARSARSR
ncbi:hypothetical protein J2S76_002134 [Ancylobacter vacuolatus]|uniref:ATP-grasp domain-containing protein n=3 Tax=Ancylobacter vacuolatus TaxID=223389 RepID=A0ABU0DH08_9HYPH|nr:hypothetical protein [Ancylobacter vacuolatus]MDQ0347707.1 hypothetical protein [Ancylobacter vacuolatus]